MRENAARVALSNDTRVDRVNHDAAGDNECSENTARGRCGCEEGHGYVLITFAF